MNCQHHRRVATGHGLPLLLGYWAWKTDPMLEGVAL